MTSFYNVRHRDHLKDKRVKKEINRFTAKPIRFYTFLRELLL